jgi:ABC-2 type transport system ATP-binding protein
MQIALTQVGKRFNRERIFGGLTHTFHSAEPAVILGSNGSGKSTLLQLIAGNTSPSEGTLAYSYQGAEVTPEALFRKLSFASPYMELLEELTLREHIAFHAGLKPFRPGISPEKALALSGLDSASGKQIRHFSSGMKQRVKLTLAILSEAPLLLLDEPCSNLDMKSVNWYQNLLSDHLKDRLLIVCSNQLEYEYPFCKQEIRMEDYKNPAR